MIVDDHQMFLDGITLMINKMEDMHLKHVARDGNEALQMLLLDSDVDVLITDISMPKVSGLDLCKKIKADYLHINMLVLSMHNDPSNIKELLSAGALGYILKNTGQNELIKAIRTVSQAESYFSEEVKNTIMNSITKSKKNSTLMPAKLSKREIEIIQLIAEEFTTNEIAEKLFISLHTVESHRKNILRKTNSRNLAGLIKYAIKKGIVE